MRPGRALLAALLLSSCGDSPADDEGRDPGSMRITLESEDAIDGRRPLLGINCGETHASIWLGLVRTPDSAAPGRSHAIIKLADQEPRRIPIRWLGEDRWVPDLPPDERTALARAVAAARSVYFLGPEGTTERPYRWDLDRLGSQLDALRRRCA